MSETASLTVTGMKCGGCETNVSTKLMNLGGVKTVSASSKDNLVKVEFDPNKTSLKAISDTIAEAGYKVVENI